MCLTLSQDTDDFVQADHRTERARHPLAQRVKNTPLRYADLRRLAVRGRLSGCQEDTRRPALDNK